MTSLQEAQGEFAVRRPYVANIPIFPYDTIIDKGNLYIGEGYFKGKFGKRVLTTRQLCDHCIEFLNFNLLRCEEVNCLEASKDATHNGQQYLITGLSGGYLPSPTQSRIEILFSAENDETAVLEMWSMSHRRIVSGATLFRCIPIS